MRSLHEINRQRAPSSEAMFITKDCSSLELTDLEVQSLVIGAVEVTVVGGHDKKVMKLRD